MRDPALHSQQPSVLSAAARKTFATTFLALSSASPDANMTMASTSFQTSIHADAACHSSGPPTAQTSFQLVRCAHSGYVGAQRHPRRAPPRPSFTESQERFAHLRLGLSCFPNSHAATPLNALAHFFFEAAKGTSSGPQKQHSGFSHDQTLTDFPSSPASTAPLLRRRLETRRIGLPGHILSSLGRTRPSILCWLQCTKRRLRKVDHKMRVRV